MKKILFLDMDGVINSVEYSVGMASIERERRFHLNDCDPVKIGLIRFICQQTDAQIVISSTWRLNKTEDWFVGFLDHVGWPMAPIIGCTPTRIVGDEHGIGRGDKIQAWLEHHAHDEHTYVILDDDSDFYDWQPLVKCNGVYGITLKETIQVIDILGLGEKGDAKRIKNLRKHVDFTVG